MLHGLFEGAQYNSEAGAKCAVYSRARTKQRRGVIKEIRYMYYKILDSIPCPNLDISSDKMLCPICLSTAANLSQLLPGSLFNHSEISSVLAATTSFG